MGSDPQDDPVVQDREHELERRRARGEIACAECRRCVNKLLAAIVYRLRTTLTRPC